MKRPFRIVLGALIAPLVYVVVAQYPYSSFLFEKWLVIHTLYAYVVFFILAGVSLVVLMALGWHRLWQYCAVMFIVAVLITFPFSVLGMSLYDSLNVPHAGLVENGQITREGYIQCTEGALLSGVVSAISMMVFWLIAFQGRMDDSRSDRASQPRRMSERE